MNGRGLSNENIIQAAEAAIGMLRDHDRDRFLLTMMAPPERRWAIAAVYGFNLELARIPDAVSEPILGRMRLQWWRDLLAGDGASGSTGGVAELLNAAISAYGIDRTLLSDAIDARETDLGEDGPMADMNAVADYADRSAGGLGEAIWRIVAGDGNPQDGARAARQAGTAFALAGIARAAPHDIVTGRSRLPADLFDASAIVGREKPDLRPAVRAVCDAARQRIAEARSLGRAPRNRLSALLPATLAESYVASLARHGYDPHDPRTGYRGAGAALRLAYNRVTGTF